MAEPERLTLDTMIPRDLWEERPRAELARRLLDLAERGEVELVVTATIRDDISYGELATRIDELPELGIRETGTVARFGSWVLGRDFLGSVEFDNVLKQLESEWKEGDPRLPDQRDWDHLHSHMLQGRDVFLTWDSQIRGLRQVLSNFGIRVMSPAEYLSARSSP